MKRLTGIIVLAIIFSLSFCGAQCWSAEKIYQMAGDISAIDLEYNTVVVEVPLKGKMLTVGGQLSSEAVLKKGGHLVNLSEFNTGDRVMVKWKLTEEGHTILLLNAR
jgi:hypothetical protein